MNPRDYVAAEINKCAEEAPRTTETMAMAKPQRLLEMAMAIEEFVDIRNWSWCDMDRVYKILKSIHG